MMPIPVQGILLHLTLALCNAIHIYINTEYCFALVVRTQNMHYVVCMIIAYITIAMYMCIVFYSMQAIGLYL